MNIYLKRIKDKVLPKTLYGRSLLIILTPVLLTQVVVGYIFFERPWDNMVNKLAHALSGEVSNITVRLEGANKVSAKVNEIIRSAKNDFDIEVSFGKYKTVDVSVNKSLGFAWYRVENKLYRELDRKLKNNFNVKTLPEHGRIEINVLLKSGKVATYTCSQKRITSPTNYIFILWLVGASVFLAMISLIFMKNQLRPIRKLAVAAEKLGKGQDIVFFKVEGATEVRQAGQAFIDMRDRIKRQIEQRTTMLAGVSHDLKTPLTRMKLQLAMMKNVPDTELLAQDIQEMENMLEGYLNFARGEGDEATEHVNLNAIIERIIGKAAREGHSVEAIFKEKEIVIPVRPMSMERAIGNIVNNACKYAKKAWVSVERDQVAVEIRVDDNGPGVPKKQWSEVFKPFFRLEKSRNQKTGGVGLGMAIAQDIIHAHGGEIYLNESEKGGLRVVMRIPL